MKRTFCSVSQAGASGRTWYTGGDAKRPRCSAAVQSPRRISSDVYRCSRSSLWFSQLPNTLLHSSGAEPKAQTLAEFRAISAGRKYDSPPGLMQLETVTHKKEKKKDNHVYEQRFKPLWITSACLNLLYRSVCLSVLRPSLASSHHPLCSNSVLRGLLSSPPSDNRNCGGRFTTSTHPPGGAVSFTLAAKVRLKSAGRIRDSRY